MNQQCIFVANWKMNFSFNETIEFATTHYDEFLELSKKKKQKLVLCPSFESLYTLNQIFKETKIAIGAQNCSAHTHGSFTGQVSAKNICETGSQFCIIGHSEQRKDLFEKNEMIAKKSANLFDYGITPILCIGESNEEYKNGKTFNSLQKQLIQVFSELQTKTNINPHITPFIAYEPIWSIGTGKAASCDHINTVFSWLTEFIKTRCSSIQWNFLYGGSIDTNNILQLKEINKISGFLIGKASLDFQKFKKIVESNIMK